MGTVPNCDGQNNTRCRPDTNSEFFQVPRVILMMHPKVPTVAMDILKVVLPSHNCLLFKMSSQLTNTKTS